MIKKYLLIVLAVSMSSCNFNLVKMEEKDRATEVFPIRPKIESYTKPPIIDRIGEDYRVTGEMVQRAIQLKEYDDRIEEWKKNFDIR